MTVRDYRCLFSGVSLLEASSALILLQPGDHGFRPISIPLIGRYLGSGFLEELEEGPHYQLLSEALNRARKDGQLLVDWQRVGIEPFAIDDLSSFLSLVAFSQIHNPEAVSFVGRPLAFCLLEANLVATLMEREPRGLEGVKLEEVATRVFANEPGAHAIYARLAGVSLRLRCKFGLSMIGSLALDQALEENGVSWEPPGLGFDARTGEREKLLSQALVRFKDQLDIVEALQEYLQGDSDQLDS